MDGSNVKKVVLPPSMIGDVLSAGGGHFGIWKTKLKVRSRYYWPGWACDMEVHVKTCPDAYVGKRRFPIVQDGFTKWVEA